MRSAASYLPQWLPLAMNGGVLLILLRQVVELKGLLEHVVVSHEGRAAVGKQAIPFALPDMNNPRVTLGLDTFGGERGVLLFVSSHCGHCAALAAALPSLGALLSSVVVVFADTAGRLALDLDGMIPCVLQAGDELARSYEIHRFPTAVLVDHQMMIAERKTPLSIDELREMLGAPAAAVPA